MATVGQARATLDDLMRTEGKAELIGGRIIKIMPAGYRPGRFAKNILRNLDQYALATGKGEAIMDGTGFAIPELPSGRESFSPDTAFVADPPPINRMGFVEGPPTFAVEVRSENDYKPSAVTAIAAKRHDYFAAGTLVVWDVDPLAETVTCYCAANPAQPTTWRRGETAEAEPAVPGWRMTVAEIFA